MVGRGIGLLFPRRHHREFYPLLFRSALTGMLCL
jgi:hypothetical protein